MTRHFRLLIIVIVSVLSGRATGQLVGSAPKLTINCGPTPACVPGRDQICVDASTGKSTPRTTANVSKRDAVNVTAYNENPFGYDYELAGDLKKVDDADLSGFLGMIAPGVTAAHTLKGTGTSISETLKELVQPLEEEEAVMLAHKPGKTPEQEIAGFVSGVEAFSTAAAEQEEQYQGLAIAYPDLAKSVYNATCPQLPQRVNDLYAPMWTTVSSLSNAHGGLRDQVGSLKTQFEEVNKDVEAAAQSQKSDLGKALSPQTQGGQSARTAYDALQKTKDLQDKLTKEKESLLGLECNYVNFIKKQVLGSLCPRTHKLRTVAADDTNFWQQKSFSSGDEPADVTVTLSKTRLSAPESLEPVASEAPQSCSKELLAQDDVPNLDQCLTRGDGDTTSGNTGNPGGGQKSKSADGQKQTADSTAKSETIATVILHFGGPRFITAAGLTFGFLASPQYDRVNGIPLDSNGQPTSGSFTSVVGLKSESQVRFAPTAFLHTRLFHSHNNEAWFATFGVGVHSNDGAAAEYLAGISHSFSDQRFFITAGAYIGQQQELRNGLYPGRDVSGISGDLPIVNHTKVRFGLAISYRFNIGGGSKDNSAAQTPDKSKSKQ